MKLVSSAVANLFAWSPMLDKMLAYLYIYRAICFVICCYGGIFSAKLFAPAQR